MLLERRPVYKTCIFYELSLSWFLCTTRKRPYTIRKSFICSGILPTLSPILSTLPTVTSTSTEREKREVKDVSERGPKRAGSTRRRTRSTGEEVDEGRGLVSSAVSLAVRDRAVVGHLADVRRKLQVRSETDLGGFVALSEVEEDI